MKSERKRAYDLEWNRAARRERKAELASRKLAAGCVDCGYRGHPAALEFDHVRGTKRFNISQNILKARNDLEAEIAKCEVRCSNCHRIRTCEQGYVR